MKNWYGLMKTCSLIKLADPHSEETCHNCSRDFVIDLLWERSGQATSYKAFDFDGNVMNAEQAAKNHNRIEREESLEKVTCPYCSTSWFSRFVRLPMQSHAPIEQPASPTSAAHDALSMPV